MNLARRGTQFLFIIGNSLREPSRVHSIGGLETVAFARFLPAAASRDQAFESSFQFLVGFPLALYTFGRYCFLLVLPLQLMPCYSKRLRDCFLLTSGAAQTQARFR